MKLKANPLTLIMGLAIGAFAIAIIAPMTLNSFVERNTQEATTVHIATAGANTPEAFTLGIHPVLSTPAATLSVNGTPFAKSVGSTPTIQWSINNTSGAIAVDSGIVAADDEVEVRASYEISEQSTGGMYVIITLVVVAVFILVLLRQARVNGSR